MATTITAAAAARSELGPGFGGQLIGPDDGGYEEARKVYNAMIDRRPALIAKCTSTADVAATIAFARAHDLLLAIRCGGHNGGGLGVVDDGVVLDLSLINGISVDPKARTVRVGGGCTLGAVDKATHEHGQATPAGIISTTGVGGLTLGGGVGHLTRTCGLTIDNMLEAEVVLADGAVVRASADQNSDLFWAIRGGGGNFGVVTEFVFRTHPVDTVFAGPTFWPIEQAGEVLRAWDEFITNAPREVNGFFLFGSVPPAPPFPEELHLRKICGVVWCYVGPEEAGAKALAPMLEVGTPLMHGAHAAPFPMLNGAFDGLYPPGEQWYWRADFINDIPAGAIEVHEKFGPAMPTWKSTMHMYPITGAAQDLSSADTAWSFRDARYAAVMVGVDPDPAKKDELREWAVDYWEALHPYSAGGAYVNFMMDEGQERVQATYRDNYPRLAQIKAKYDPGNVFRVNQNIKP
jgi:FAD/FMN-containing dehydrogenase